jgi:pimeloyl-ACP methyl ester carboxylesterase
MARLHTTTTSALSLALLLCAQVAPAEEPGEEAAPAAAVSSERAPLAERSQAEALALQQRLPAGEQQQLSAGDEHFLALWQPANKGKAQGVVILLPGAGETADWPQAIGPLRRKLPDAGWHTLSLTLPDPLPSAEPSVSDSPSEPAAAGTTTDEPATGSTAEPDSPTTSDSEPPNATDSATADVRESPEQYGERVLARLQAAIELAQQQKPDSIVLLGHGTGAYWAARYLSEHNNSSIQNLILVAPELPEQFSPALNELLPKLRLAIGDFYYRDQELARTAALQRRQASKRQPSPSYIQIAMSALPGNPAIEQEQLYRRVRGWLSLHLQASPKP